MPTTKVLLVDDEEDFDHLMKLSLEADGGFDVHYVSRPNLAINAAREFKPDVIILDLNMPGMSGDELVVQLENDSNLSAIPVIFLTASYSSGSNEDHPTILGHPCIEKPTTIEEVVVVIAQCLNGSLKRGG